jgi:hypothetical protein
MDVLNVSEYYDKPPGATHYFQKSNEFGFKTCDPCISTDIYVI